MAEPLQIIVVDDDGTVLRLYARILQQAGCHVLTAENSKEALRLARAHKPALAIIDIHLPGATDGYELCRILRQDNRSPTEVFLVTGVFTQESDRLKAYEAGAVGFWVKPLERNRLVEEVRFFLAPPAPFLQLPRTKPKRGGVLVAAPPTLGKVLVVDDDEEMLSAVGLHLEGDSLLPYIARSGYHAIALAHKIKPQAIILDVKLPDVDGVAVMRLLRAHPRTGGIPILVWTGSTKKGLELSCLQDGADEYLVKGAHAVSAIPIRIKKMLGLEESQTKTAEVGPLKIDRPTHSVWAKGESVHGLTFKEFELLFYLVERSPAIVSWNDLERDVWKVPQDQLTHSHASHTIEVHCERLRTKLGHKVAPCLVVHKGIGLQFDPSQANP